LKPVVAGSSSLNASFFEVGLIDTMIVDIEPVIFSPGCLFAGQGIIECRLRLDKVVEYGEDCVQIQYSVIK
jgi:riboflavin biosynthesis pyrimidine reductase